jgi:predicted nuclease of predicted toxin-antitoxin system
MRPPFWNKSTAEVRTRGWPHCQREGRILVTLDMDFADIRAHPPAEFPGLIVLRLRQQDKPHVLNVLAHLIQLLGQESLDRRLWIVEETRVRIRG